MKKALIMLVVATEMAFACGGCIDIGTPTNLSASSQSTFNQIEAELSQKIEILNQRLQKTFVDNEQRNLNDDKALTILTTHKLLTEQNINALLEVQNRLQSTNNSIDGI